jgi:hypothetical protein
MIEELGSGCPLADFVLSPFYTAKMGVLPDKAY